LYRILDHLVRFGSGYIVYGNWMCENKDDEYECEYECQKKFEHYELVGLSKLNLKNQLKNRLSEQCDKCDETLLITSFRLYTAPILDIKREKPTIEILRHLEWNEYYR
ncbi:4574_t:CDS:2, partial [Acaulospora morrowiae]